MMMYHALTSSVLSLLRSGPITGNSRLLLFLSHPGFTGPRRSGTRNSLVIFLSSLFIHFFSLARNHSTWSSGRSKKWRENPLGSVDSSSHDMRSSWTESCLRTICCPPAWLFLCREDPRWTNNPLFPELDVMSGLDEPQVSSKTSRNVDLRPSCQNITSIRAVKCRTVCPFDPTSPFLGTHMHGVEHPPSIYLPKRSPYITRSISLNCRIYGP